VSRRAPSVARGTARSGALATAMLIASISTVDVVAQPVEPIIDVHLHSHSFWTGPPAGDTTWFRPMQRAGSREELIRRSVAELERCNVVCAVASSFSLAETRAWADALPGRVIPALQTTLAPPTDELVQRLREQFSSGEVRVLGEIHNAAPGSEPLDPIYELAAEFDVPVAIHMGDGFPGAAYADFPSYRMRNNRPLRLEDMLGRHPRLRVYLMHAGWPFQDEIVALMYGHPHVFVDVGMIAWYLPEGEFHSYLRRLVGAGFGDRILFGTDHMQWPQAIGLAVQAIESADFLSNEQKRAIFYNNAVRFLRLDPDAPCQMR